MCKVSVIMGAYNCEKTIGNSIESILSQTFEDWEFIICDDCSSDSTFSIIKDYAKQDNRIKIITNKKNMRLAATLNHCLEYANGVYIARMDADDISLPERLKIQVDFLDNNPEASVVGSRVIVFDEYGDQGIRGIGGWAKKDAFKRGTPFIHPTIMMRKESYVLLDGYTVSKATMRAEDLDLWFRFFSLGLRGYNIETPLLRYHESLRDYKKRSLEAAIQTVKIKCKGYQQLKFPFSYYIFALRPIVSAILPNRLIKKYHKKKLNSFK